MRLRHAVPVVLAAGLLMAADEPAQNEIQGTWTILSFEQDGQKKDVEDLKVTFQEGKYTLSSDSGFTDSRGGKYMLDTKESPKQITIVPGDGPEEGKPIMGIYRITNDRMEACYDPSGAGRPREFAAKPGTKNILVTYKKGS